jgi:hypothetical protein
VQARHFEGPPYLLLAALTIPSVALGWLWPSSWLALAPVAVILPISQAWLHSCGHSCGSEATIGEAVFLTSVFYAFPGTVAVYLGIGLRLSRSTNQTDAKTKHGEEAG